MHSHFFVSLELVQSCQVHERQKREISHHDMVNGGSTIRVPTNILPTLPIIKEYLRLRYGVWS